MFQQQVCSTRRVATCIVDLLAPPPPPPPPPPLFPPFPLHIVNFVRLL